MPEDVVAASNAAVSDAADMFLELEGIDTEPTAAVACLRDAAAREKIRKESVVLLNVTGGGRPQAQKGLFAGPGDPSVAARQGEACRSGNGIQGGGTGDGLGYCLAALPR